jgi:DNA-binding ferritin-like protein (Dps family)
MAAKWIEALTGSLEQKKQYRQDTARIEGLPEPYRAAAKAVHRYFTYYGGITDGDTLILMLGDLADLWERAAADDVAQAYNGQQWIDKERARLRKAIDDAERGERGERQ